MRKISMFLTILITSFVMVLSGLVASPIASAGENKTVRVYAKFSSGSSVLTKSQKAEIKKAVASSGSGATFIATGTAGKLPGLSSKKTKALGKARAKAIKAYLVSLGVSETSVTTEANVTNIGVDPSSVRYPTPAPTPTPTVTAAAASTGSGSSSGGGGTPTVTCALGGTCIVGDRGPGGGIVFYVSAANFASVGSTCGTACKYLEVAPATWQDTETTIDPIYTTVRDDLKYQWSNNTAALTLQDITTVSTEGIAANAANEKLNWQIGQGFNNTSLMIVSGATSAAKVAVLLYAGNSTAGQWFIPSMNELNELCKYARGQTTGVLTVACVYGSGRFKSTANNVGTDLGGFRDAPFYWSSSEKDSGDAWLQHFTLGEQRNGPKDELIFDRFVRPIRAF